jgi:hypothetical protein
MAASSRIGGIDFWRGIVLIAILVDHIPGNLLEFVTPRNFGLSDSAEAFVFLSGLSVGAIYVPRARALGVVGIATSCLRRALKLYGVHIATTAVALAIFALAAYFSGLDQLTAIHGRAIVLKQPAVGVPGVVLLSHQIGYFNILPLYIGLMVWAPLAVALALANPRLALAASAGLYLAARAFGLHLPNWPEPGGWFFNPLAWQLLFTLGIVASVGGRDGFARRNAALVVTSGLAVAAAAIVVTDAFGLAPGLRDLANAHVDLGKQDLGLARLVHFCALAYLVAVSPGLARLASGRFGLALQRLGRHSLAVFAVGSLLAALGQALLAVAAASAPSLVVSGIGIAYTLASVAVLFALARRLDCPDALKPIPALLASLRERRRARRSPERSLLAG